MGKILTDVLTLEQEGLVGFTEIGEQIPLRRVFCSSISEDLENSKEDLIKGLGEKEYVQFTYEDSSIINYTYYEERE
jgi:hypothetical protein